MPDAQDDNANTSVVLSSSSTDSEVAVGFNDGPEGSSNIVVDDRRYPLDAALGDIWGITGDYYNVNFTVTNGSFRLEPTELNGQSHTLLVPAQASATVYAEMFYRGQSFKFEDIDYFFEPSPADVSSGEAFFSNAYVAIDTDSNGELEANERFAIVEGTVSFLGLLPDLEVRFTVALANGQIATGYYTGLFDFTDRRPIAPGIVSAQPGLSLHR